MSTTARKSSSIQAIAIAQDRDVMRVASRGGLFAQRLWRLAASAVRNRGAAVFDKRHVELLENELIDMMTYGFLLRRRLDTRRRSTAKSIELGYAHEQARRIASQFNIDLGNLQDKFRTLARRSLRGTLADVRKTINSALAQARYRELTARQSTAFVLTRLRKHGIEPRQTSYVDTLVKTHAAIAYGAASRIGYMVDTDVWGFELVSMRDDRVRDAHVETDGIRRKKNDKFWDMWWPPNGWGCRCQAVPIYDHSTRQTPVPDDLEIDEAFETDWSYLVR